MTRFLIGFGLCLLLVLTAVIGFYRLPGGALRANIAFDGRCSPLQGVGGADDLEIDPMKRRAFVSSFSASASGSGVARGAIAAFSIDDPLSENAWSDRTLGEPAVFAPLGLHLYQREGARRLFVVNAAAKSVELYDVGDDGALSHVETFTERRLTSPNDVVAVGERAFYVTNDAEPGRRGFLGALESLFPMREGKILYFDGLSWRIAAEGLRLANGIAASADGARLYVAETGAGSLRIYDRDPKTGSLTLAKTVRIGAAVDNVNVDEGGALWIAAHVRGGLAPSSGKRANARSLVLRYNDFAGAETKPVAIYAEDGDGPSPSIAAARLGSTLLVSGLGEKNVLICALPAPAAR